MAEIYILTYEDLVALGLILGLAEEIQQEELRGAVGQTAFLGEEMTRRFR